MQNNIPFDQRDFFKKPFNRAGIVSLLKGRPAAEMFNERSPSARKLDRDVAQYSNDELIELMVVEPRLIRRPVVKIGGRVHFGADAKVLETLLG
ncbi:MAG: hypothetical protein MUO19_03550 [Dehalococcoidales bacterium]|nr:hypothetical protein [Dehalococcoidales bacterium]